MLFRSDDTVFKLPKEKRLEWLAQHRAEVIEKLNRDCAKPWFGWKKDGSVVEDIGFMTYEETVLRMVRLMYVAHENRWVDKSLRNLTGDWLRRIEERFAGVNGAPKASFIQSFNSLDTPATFVDSFFTQYPAATTQLLAAEDVAYFLAISQRPGQKPVPFISVLDSSFEVWFKKVCVYFEFFRGYFLTYFLVRIRCGLLRISKPFSTRIPSVFVFCKAPSQSNTQSRRMSPSASCSAESSPH